MYGTLIITRSKRLTLFCTSGYIIVQFDEAIILSGLKQNCLQFNVDKLTIREN